MTAKKYEQRLFGIKPYQYRRTKTASFNKEVFVNTYTLYTDDWFESGTNFAYSLHKTLEAAENYKSMNCWVPDFGSGEVAYVSKKTLEAICKEKTHRGQGLFVSMER